MVFKKSLKGLLAGLLVGAGALMPQGVFGAGYLGIWNYSSSPGINENKINFIENGTDGSGPSPPSLPYLDIYYLDSNSNKLGVAGVNLSSNKSYYCPLVCNGTIPDGTSNSIAFRIVSSFPTNTLTTAKIVVDGKYTNTINDVLSYTAANSNSSGYAFINLPNITNAVSGTRYGSVTMTFGPAPQTFTVNIENGAKYGLNPTNFTGVANGGSVTSTAANVYYTNSVGTRTKITGLEKKL